MAHLPKGQGVIPLPPFKAWLASNIPAVYDNTMTYYEELCALLKYLQDLVVPALNSNANAITVLSDYVENYFKNLDVQDEIDNKLDQMAEDGTLQEIVSSYLQASVAWTFDTVADMKSATNLIDGSYARTLGFRSVNDGGGALYKISDNGTANEMDVIAIGSLYATLIKPIILTPEMFGAYGDDLTDDTTFIQRAVDLGNVVDMLGKSYRTTAKIDINKSNIELKNGTIHTLTTDFCIKLSGDIHDVTINNITASHIGTITNDTRIRFISSDSSTDNNFVNCKFINNKVSNFNVGISINADLGGSFKDCYIGYNIIHDMIGIDPGSGYGIHVSNGSSDYTNTIIEGNETYYCHRHCIYTARGRGYFVLNNFVHNNTTVSHGGYKPAMYIGRSREATVKGNYFKDCKNGLLYINSELNPTSDYELTAYPATGITVENNTFEGETDKGSLVIGYADEGVAHVDHIVVRNNKFLSTGIFEIYACSNAFIEDNYFENCASYGIRIQGGNSPTETLYMHDIYVTHNQFIMSGTSASVRLNPNVCNNDYSVTFVENISNANRILNAATNVSNTQIQVINQKWNSDFTFVSPATFKAYTINTVAV